MGDRRGLSIVVGVDIVGVVVVVVVPPINRTSIPLKKKIIIKKFKIQNSKIGREIVFFRSLLLL